MKTYIKNIALSAFLLSSCVHSVHQVGVSDFEPFGGNGKGIESQAEQFVIMGVTSETNYADEAYQMLLSQCQGGEIRGVFTRYSTSLGFFSWTNKILIKGQCFKS
ncbi:MAG: hypothetical protein KA436_00995 [Oligoflexales bacterium]|nr:hypothetical protein [Oligoflexales bacterium]